MHTFPALVRAAALGAWAAVLATPPAARACSLCPIDDFEAGGFSYSGTTYQQHSVPIPGYQSHSVSSARTVTLQVSGTWGQMQLNPGTSVDDYVTLNIPTGGSAQIRWEWGFPVDVTFGGAVDCVDLVVDGEDGAEVLLEIGDAGGSTSVSRWLVSHDGPQTVSWDLSQFLGSQLVDITQATYMELNFHAPPSGNWAYLAYDVRFGQAATGPADFQGNFVATQVPPVPSPPLVFTLLDAVTAQPIWESQVAIASALTDAQTVPALSWDWTQTQIPGYDVAMMTLQSDEFDVWETTFDLGFDAAGVAGVAPVLYPPDPIYTAQSIVISFLVMTKDAMGNVNGSSSSWVTFDFDDQQLGSLEFQEVWVTPGTAKSATSGFTLHFRMAYSGMNTPDYAFPLIHANWISDWTTQIGTGVAEPAVPADDGALRLTAVPSVTRGGTEIRASRPFGRATSVLIHDVTGRRVRSLPVAAGASAVRWDGRSREGRPAAAGVYFLRLDDGSTATTRVVKTGVK